MDPLGREIQREGWQKPITNWQDNPATCTLDQSWAFATTVATTGQYMKAKQWLLVPCRYIFWSSPCFDTQVLIFLCLHVTEALTREGAVVVAGPTLLWILIFI